MIDFKERFFIYKILIFKKKTDEKSLALAFIQQPFLISRNDNWSSAYLYDKKKSQCVSDIDSGFF